MPGEWRRATLKETHNSHDRLHTERQHFQTLVELLGYPNNKTSPQNRLNHIHTSHTTHTEQAVFT